MLPPVATVEDLVAKGKVKDLLTNAKLKLSGVSKVHFFDPGAANDRKLPLECAVKKGIKLPPNILNMLEGICLVRRVRAILSWVTAPPSGNPNWKPFWGNAFETNIRFHR